MKDRSHYADFSALMDVLGKLEQVADLVRCSAVCKSWQAACQRVHPTSICVIPHVYPREIMFNPEGLVGVVKWLQLKNRAGCLHSLQKVCVSIHGDFDCTRDCHQDQHLQSFSQSISALAGSWHLRHYSMILHSPLDTAVPMLPPSLQHLVLEVRTARVPECVCLWMFEGLRELETLELVLSSEEEQSVIAQRQRTAEFRVDAHLTAVTSLKLSPWVMNMPAEKTLSDYMPSLQTLNVVETPAQAQPLIDLASLHILTLNIISLHAAHEPHLLEVDASSRLRLLKIFCSSPNHMTLLVNNANVRYSTRGIHGVNSPDLDADDFHGDLSD